MLDDTLIYYMIGDNGASAKARRTGPSTRCSRSNGAASFETPNSWPPISMTRDPRGVQPLRRGLGPCYEHPVPVDHQVASHFGGSRNGTIVHWPHGIAAKGEVRNQFHHVIDVAATVLDVIGLPEPTFVNGVEQLPLHGVSMAYLFDDAGAAERRETQYFEMVSIRGIYHRGWTAVTRHSIPWLFGATLPALDDDVWELYNLARTGLSPTIFADRSPRSSPSSRGSS